jgi:hypothetical protein
MIDFKTLGELEALPTDDFLPALTELAKKVAKKDLSDPETLFEISLIKQLFEQKMEPLLKKLKKTQRAVESLTDTLFDMLSDSDDGKLDSIFTIDASNKKDDLPN